MSVLDYKCPECNTPLFPSLFTDTWTCLNCDKEWPTEVLFRKVLSLECFECGKELCEALDGYYGTDKWEKMKCVDCRHGRKYKDVKI